VTGVDTDAQRTKVISVHAPWAWALMSGGKDVENRGLRFTRKVLGRVWVHASLWPGSVNEDTAGYYALHDEIHDIEYIIAQQTAERLDVKSGESFYSMTPPFHVVKAIRGHIVGSIEVYGYQTPDNPPDSPWYVPGSLAIMVRNPIPLAQPVPAKGALGWWTPTEDVMAQLSEAAP